MFAIEAEKFVAFAAFDQITWVEKWLHQGHCSFYLTPWNEKWAQAATYRHFKRLKKFLMMDTTWLSEQPSFLDICALHLKYYVL